MGYSNGRWSGTGRFSSPSASQARDAATQGEDEVALAKDERAAEPIRAYYTKATGSRIKSFGPTSFDVGLGLNDQEAFDACVENFGFGAAVRALKLVSRRAKECAAAYRARMARRSS